MNLTEIFRISVDFFTEYTCRTVISPYSLAPINKKLNKIDKINFEKKRVTHGWVTVVVLVAVLLVTFGVGFCVFWTLGHGRSTLLSEKR